MNQDMRHWTSRSNYTALDYRGFVPKRVWRNEYGTVVPCIPSVWKEAPKSSEDLTKEQAAYLKKGTYLGMLYTTRQFPTALELEIAHRSLKSGSTVILDGPLADLERWNDPPHVEFANCQLNNNDDAERFIETYGVSLLMCSYDKSEKELEPVIEINWLRTYQHSLRDAWRGSETAFEHLSMWRPEKIEFKNGRPVLISDDIWKFICALFLADHSDNRLRVCENPACSRLKYFVQERRDQKFCSESCRNTVNVHRWLAIQENRDHWNAARRKDHSGQPGPPG
jgi:hypothetical protein